jgi:para-nitrobenzyl esterase
MLRERDVSIQQQQSVRRRAPLWNAICSALVLGAATWAAPASAEPVVAVTPDGIFQGKLDTTGTMREFLGVRYAEPVT